MKLAFKNMKHSLPNQAQQLCNNLPKLTWCNSIRYASLSLLLIEKNSIVKLVR